MHAENRERGGFPILLQRARGLPPPRPRAQLSPQVVEIPSTTPSQETSHAPRGPFPCRNRRPDSFGQGAYIPAKALLAQVLLQHAFAETIATGRITKPWRWADTWPIARIEVKRIHASAIVLEGSSGQALAFGPGHVELTPNAGERGVAVYAAHRDTHFRFLRNVAIGDEIDVTRSDGKTFRYRADGSSVVRFDNSGIDPLSKGYELVLSTCWPFGALTSGPDRYLLHATMIGQGG